MSARSQDNTDEAGGSGSENEVIVKKDGSIIDQTSGANEGPKLKTKKEKEREKKEREKQRKKEQVSSFK